MNPFLNFVAARTLALLDLRKARIDPSLTSFYVWERPDRVVVIFDTTAIDTGKVNEDFAHRLSTQLQGRLVVRTNSRGLYLQVGYDIPPALMELTASSLDLSKQPSAYHMPIGSTASGRDLWLSLLEGDSFLVAGSRGMGKTGFIHGAIQALLKGGAVEIYGFDGKSGVEFARYGEYPFFHLVTKLGKTLDDLNGIARERRLMLLSSGQPDIIRYNALAQGNPMLPIVIVVDEAALTTDEEKAGLVKIIERERATGFYPILATNRPEASALLVKSNLVTRICFPVPSWHASQMALGQNGAESLPKIQGRGLIVHQARVTEFQSFVVTYPQPSQDTVRMMLDDEEQPTQPTPAVVDEIAEMAERIRAQWTPGMSGRHVAVKLLGLSQYGGSLKTKTDKVIEYLVATTPPATTTQNVPLIGSIATEMA